MAARESYASDRRQSGGYSSARSKAGQAYMYGNVVAKPEYEPKKNRSSVKRRKKVSRQVQKNRNRALHMNAAYVVFLTIAATIVLLLCVNYVRLQSVLTKHSKNVTALQEELADLKEENTTKYNAVVDSVNLDEILSEMVEQIRFQKSSFFRLFLLLIKNGRVKTRPFVIFSSSSLKSPFRDGMRPSSC